MKRFFKKLLTSPITAAVLLGVALGGVVMTIVSLAVPALTATVGIPLGVAFVNGVAYALTKYADFAISAKEGEKLLEADAQKEDNSSVIEGEDFVLTETNENVVNHSQEVVGETQEERIKKDIEKFNIELDEMGK